MNLKNLLILILGGALLVSLLTSKLTYNEYELYRDAEEKRHREIVRSLEQRLTKSEESRDSVNALIDSLNANHRVLRIADSLKIIELSKIPGKFNNKNSEELQKEMIKQYQQRQ